MGAMVAVVVVVGRAEGEERERREVVLDEVEEGRGGEEGMEELRN